MARSSCEKYRMGMDFRASSVRTELTPDEVLLVNPTTEKDCSCSHSGPPTITRLAATVLATALLAESLLHVAAVQHAG